MRKEEVEDSNHTVVSDKATRPQIFLNWHPVIVVKMHLQLGRIHGPRKAFVRPMRRLEVTPQYERTLHWSYINHMCKEKKASKVLVCSALIVLQL
jgi:hypothetical protein